MSKLEEIKEKLEKIRNDICFNPSGFKTGVGNLENLISLIDLYIQEDYKIIKQEKEGGEGGE
jgi:hypothetical protein